LMGRRDDSHLRRVELLQTADIVEGVDVEQLDALDDVVRQLRPGAVINCVGVIKQRPSATDAIPSITVNALVPHRLARVAAEIGARLVHFSTDCVFSGSRGDYGEEDFPDAYDLYGRSKFLGEVATPNALTLRTSIIGRELQHHRSLLDWFLAQRGGTVRGYERVFWSGVTTNHLASLVGDLLAYAPALGGVYQVAGQKLSKYDLLLRLRAAYGLDVEIVPDSEVTMDRSLRGDRLFEATGYRSPSWDEMLSELATDPTPYDRWERTNVTV
nr:SDR family oxidoreductase [Gemmatimonadaceae bacterium]